MAKYSFSNSNNWELSAEIEREVEYLNAAQTSYERIPEITSPLLLHSNVVAINVQSPSSPPHYRFAGLVTQAISTGIQNGGFPEAESNSRKKIWLGRTTIIEWDNLADSYALRIAIPYWIKDVQILIFEYVEPPPPD